MIAGMCKIWARRLTGDTKQYWFAMPYAPRGYSECVTLVEYYEGEWPNAYEYCITADSNLCRPLA